jgi:hypothetical protein
MFESFIVLRQVLDIFSPPASADSFLSNPMITLRIVATPTLTDGGTRLSAIWGLRTKSQMIQYPLVAYISIVQEFTR